MPRKAEDRVQMRMVHILIPKDLHRLVRIRCADEECSIQQYVLGLIDRDMKGYKMPGRK